MHITEISWIQLTLIEVGAMSHVAAFCAFLRDNAKPTRAIHGDREPHQSRDGETKREFPRARLPAQVVHYRRELRGVMEDVPPDIAPGMLAKTAKVNFKQTFKVHKEESHFVPGARC